MIRTIAAAIFALLAVTAPTHAAYVNIDGSFAGIITSGANAGDPVSGTFAYNTANLLPDVIENGYGESWIGPIASSYTVNEITTSLPANPNSTVGMYSAGAGSFILMTAALNLNFSSPVFPSQYQALYGNPNVTFAANNIDWTGIVNGTNVQIHSFDIGVVPLPATLPLFGSALAGLGGIGWLKRRKVSHIRRG